MLQIHIVHILGEKRSSIFSCKAILPPFSYYNFYLNHYILYFLKIPPAYFFLSDCMSWIVFLKIGKCLLEINAERKKSDRLTVAKLNAVKQFNKQDHKSKLMTEKYSLLPLNPQQLTPV